ncbi:MAG: tetratricopeptide repeat protein [Planctomycetota bacterium]
MKRPVCFSFIGLALAFGCLVLVSTAMGGEELAHRSVQEALETARTQQTPVMVLLRVEAHDDADLGRRVGDSTKNLPIKPVGVQLVYPKEAYARPRVAQEFVRCADLVGATRLPALAWFGVDGRPCGLIELDAETHADELGDLVATMYEKYNSSVAARDRAQGLSGTARARCLHEYLQFIDPPCRHSYQDVMAQIVTLDPDNAVGLKAVYEPVLTETAINTTIQEQVYPLIDAGGYTQAHEVLGTLLREQPVTAEQRQLLMAFQAQLLHTQNRTPEAIALIDEALALGAEGPAQEKLLKARQQFTSN